VLPGPVTREEWHPDLAAFAHHAGHISHVILSNAKDLLLRAPALESRSFALLRMTKAGCSG